MLVFAVFTTSTNDLDSIWSTAAGAKARVAEAPLSEPRYYKPVVVQVAE